MRTSRLTIIAAFLFTSIALLYTSRRNAHADDAFGVQHAESRSRLFSFQTPLSLFPPNAIISLTDDNTTSFLARPAAFGPLLPATGLSGQLWIGSGFGDDGPRQGTINAGAEGELGCSDVPGWNDGQAKTPGISVGSKAVTKPVSGGNKNAKRSTDKMTDPDRVTDPKSEYPEKHHQLVDDGTDDYLHQSPDSENIKSGKEETQSSGTNSKHADIQSIQEGAEIAGKVVLLSRGGCGFLEKVKWVQRRGGVALIVGDDTRGGPLIQMYARGDTSNVTIPSVFTSHTTAHLLSSLIPSGSYIEDTIDDSGNFAVKVQQSDKTNKKKPKPESKQQPKKPLAVSNEVPPKKGWFSWFSFSSGNSDTKSGSDWIMVTEYNEEEDIVKGDPKANTPSNSKKPNKPNTAPAGDDDFVIGVQDWRDPDLVDPPTKGNKVKDTPSKADKKPLAHTPPATTISHAGNILAEGSQGSAKGSESDAKPGLLSRIFGEDEDESEASTSADVHAEGAIFDHDSDEHEGLWVTLTPTSAATPFFDTLLVLVVSPLITLTVVYALLLLRSRIRRRRWRAPKSVVERLPVRTYQTINSSTTHSSRLPSPTSSSPTTPLLQNSSRPRPRSRTTSGIPEPGVLSRQNSDLLRPPPSTRNEPHHEKVSSTGGSEWKKYMGKQVECVVCLEEYIDGVSRVMSLPCGHEFHVDCITPWLTTRRRTCPICKGDVVRSLARSSHSPSHSPIHSPSPSGRSTPLNSPYSPYHDDDRSIHSEDIQAQAAETVNTSPESRFPVFGHGDGDDLEHGVVSPTPRRPRRTEAGNGWRGLFGGTGSSSRRSDNDTQDRSR